MFQKIIIILIIIACIFAKCQAIENESSDEERVPRSPKELQELLNRVKSKCAKKLGLPANIKDKILLHETNPTQKEKCLMECILKGTKLMDEKNRLSTASSANLAGMISNKNELVIAIAAATAENCNRRLTAKEPCEAAFQINKCIGREMLTHRIKIFY